MKRKKKRRFRNSETIPRIKRKSKIKSFSVVPDSVLDRPITEIINIKKKQQAELEQKVCDYSDRIEDENFDGDKYAIYDQMGEDYFYIDEINDELLALGEIRIIYAYKYFEIQLKKLISTAFDDQSIYKLYRWNQIIDYLKLRNITPSNLPYYNEILQLKDANNTFKHSEENDKISYIPEFSDGEDISHLDLEDFYKRIKDAPRKFIEALAEVLEKELFEFDEKKLENLAKPLFDRMDKETAQKFIETFSKLYE